LCSDCEADDAIAGAHEGGIHLFAKIRDSSTINTDTFKKYQKQVESLAKSFMFAPQKLQDSFGFHVSANHATIKNDPKALDLVKKMLVVENKYRLSKEYLTKYAESQTDQWKTDVTEEIQQRVVNEHMDQAQGYYTSLESGIDFLRGAVGNFPDHVPELMECANYVKYTQGCKRGHLRVGDVIDGNIPLMDPLSSKKELLSDYFSDKPLVIASSSYT